MEEQHPAILSHFPRWTMITPASFKEYHARYTAMPSGINYHKDQDKSLDLIELHNFSKTIKRDSSVFPKLQNDKYFDPFCRTFMIIAEQQSCSEVLDPTYVPTSDPAVKALFNKKNSYMYSVLHQCLLTDKGKYLTRKYAKTYDAQKVWEEFVYHIKRSSKGEQAKAELHEYITSAAIDSTYKGKTESFILSYIQNFRRLDDMTDASEQMSYPFRINMLKKSVKSIPELEMVSTLDEYNRVMYNPTFTPEDAYDTYLTLLTNAAIRYDNKIGDRRSKRSVQIHEQFADASESEDSNPHFLKLNEYDNNIDPYNNYEGTPYGGIDLPVSDLLQINQYKQQPKRSSFQQKPRPSFPKSNDSHNKDNNPSMKYTGPIFIPPELYRLTSKEFRDALTQYNAKAPKTRPKIMNPPHRTMGSLIMYLKMQNRLSLLESQI